MKSENEVSVLGAVLKALPSAKLKDLRQQRHFIKLGVFAMHSTLFHLAKQYAEAKHVAGKLSEKEKPEISTINLVLKVDFTNLDNLQADMDSKAKPFASQYNTSISEDISQMQLDFNGKEVTGVSGETKPIDPDDEDEEDDTDDSEDESDIDESDETPQVTTEIPNAAEEEDPEPEPAQEPKMEDLKLPELKSRAKALGIVGFSKLTRDALIEQIKAAELEDAQQHDNVVKMQHHAAA